MPRSALFLDRDGVINLDRGYVHRQEQFEFLPGIFALARYAVGVLRWPVIVVTNQSGIGRGYFDEAAYAALTRWMCERFAAAGAPLTKVYHCPYHAEHGIGDYRQDHPWRKPKPGMLLQAASDFDLDLARSVLIGDEMSDMECAAAAGIGLRVRLDPLAATPQGGPVAHEVARDLGEALRLLQHRVERLNTGASL